MKMKESFNRLWQEIAKVIRWILKNPSLLKKVLRLLYLISKLIEYFDN